MYNNLYSIKMNPSGLIVELVKLNTTVRHDGYAYYSGFCPTT